MDVRRRLLTIDQSHYMWMVESLEDMDFRVQVLFQLFVKLLHVDRLDGDVAGLFLFEDKLISIYNVKRDDA